MERMPDKIDSKFRFVLLAAQRAEQLLRGARPKVEPENKKPARVAMDEVGNDLLYWDYGPRPDEELEAAYDEEGAELEAG